MSELYYQISDTKRVSTSLSERSREVLLRCAQHGIKTKGDYDYIVAQVPSCLWGVLREAKALSEFDLTGWAPKDCLVELSSAVWGQDGFIGGRVSTSVRKDYVNVVDCFEANDYQDNLYFLAPSEFSEHPNAWVGTAWFQRQYLIYNKSDLPENLK